MSTGSAHRNGRSRLQLPNLGHALSDLADARRADEITDSGAGTDRGGPSAGRRFRVRSRPGRRAFCSPANERSGRCRSWRTRGARSRQGPRGSAAPCGSRPDAVRVVGAAKHPWQSLSHQSSGSPGPLRSPRPSAVWRLRVEAGRPIVSAKSLVVPLGTGASCARSIAPGVASEHRAVHPPRQRRSRSTGGTGFGLAFVKDIVERHHGRVTVEDSPSGARFVVPLPPDE
jgi:hypothetical protein